jgi:hypothetical protein
MPRPFPRNPGSPIRAGPRQYLPDLQPTSFDQLDLGRIPSMESRAPLVEPSRMSFVVTAFSHRLQNLGKKIVLRKPDIASQLSRADNGSGKVQ